MYPIDISQLSELSQAVGHLIKNELATGSTVSTFADQIIVSISCFEVEHRLGNLLQQIYRTVDQRFPVRSENLSIVIRDVEGIYENTFKIWKSAS